jgi:hypothetical protein
MTPRIRPVVLLAALVALVATAPVTAQRTAVPRPQHQGESRPPVAVHGSVFIGGYFYDPMFGPYPWWPMGAYPRWYVPIYDHRAEIRIVVHPKPAEQAAVYVDGFYAGIVDDFNNVFQALPLPPGGHRLVLYLEGYRTVHKNVYLHPGSMLRFEATMDRLPSGATSELPEVVAPVPEPPEGTYRPPVTPRRAPLPLEEAPISATGFGTLYLVVQPAGATVALDGEPWVSSDEYRFQLHLPQGPHQLQVSRAGYDTFRTTLTIHDGQWTRLNVSLMPGSH